MAAGVKPGSQAWLRAANQRRVVKAVRGTEEMTQSGIARATGLSAATVSNIVRELRDQGVLVVTPTSAGGRRAQVVSLSSRTGLLLGADFGHTHLRVVVGNLAHEVLAESAIPLDVDASADDGLASTERLADAMLEALGGERSSILGLGVGLPGPIDLATGTLGSSTILPGWVGVNPVAELTRRFGPSVCVDNDANVGALAETTWGAARGCSNAVYVKIGWGVGAGVVIGSGLGVVAQAEGDAADPRRFHLHRLAVDRDAASIADIGAEAVALSVSGTC
ncbi:MAG: nagC 5 [Streptosporangiaceae bacterium]|jgi:biotin operon repressor|nr:nagC 5 [Streptosporangiaceae bacterium]